MARARKRQIDNGNQDSTFVPAAAPTGKEKNAHSHAVNSSIVEGGQLTETHYKQMYLELEKKVLKMMLHKLQLEKELYMTRAKVSEYEKMMVEPGVTLLISPSTSTIPPTDHAAAPQAAATNLQKGSSAKTKKMTKKKQAAKGEDEASPRKKKKTKA